MDKGKTLNEKAIWGQVYKACRAYEEALAKPGQALSRLEAIADAYSYAIAEKMAEGVVAWIEGRWTKDDLGYYVLTVASGSNYEGQRIRLATVAPDTLDDYYGQLVTVTVRKVESDANGK